MCYPGGEVLTYAFLFLSGKKSGKALGRGEEPPEPEASLRLKGRSEEEAGLTRQELPWASPPGSKSAEFWGLTAPPTLTILQPRPS